jgi:hypothetical protein
MKKLILIFFTIFLSSCGNLIQYIGSENLQYKNKVELIKEGTSLAEVEDILGKPLSVVSYKKAEHGAVKTLTYKMLRFEVPHSSRSSEGVSINNTLGLMFNEKDKVVHIFHNLESGFYEKILEDKKMQKKIIETYKP